MTWDYELRRPDQVGEVVGRAFQIAASDPPGPVYLTLPREVLMDTLGEVTLYRPERVPPAKLGAGDPTLLRGVGIKLAQPDRQVVALVGDGSFVFGEPLAALWASQTQRAPILVVIFDNGCYNATRSPLVAAYPSGHSVTANDFVGIDLLPAPRYGLLAPVVGAYGERVEDPSEVLPALRRGWNASRAVNRSFSTCSQPIPEDQ